MRTQLASVVAQRKSVTIVAPFLTTLEKLKIRNLYLTQQLTHEEIGRQVGKSVAQVSRYVSRVGLPEIRKKREALLIARADEKNVAISEDVSEAIAGECEEIALESLVRAKNEVKSTHKDAAKNFQAWTAGIRNLTTARNLARGKAEVNTMDGESRSVNLFFLGGEAGKSMKRVSDVDTVL